ncbi:recombinase family protein [Streptomyces solicathayae]|uniref:Recombinase family protein n=1 Tax=Streptomyces solicathayae TaxID=3081768 RepID=A0ABZ0LVI6_9ACTN|nr:recombinase family protein [Streptomyces sp. HUAS YS2]WOX23515.1 recombinase family protein [Streptomyces sp. HUAS YS2]
MIDTRDAERASRTFSRWYVAPELQMWLDKGGTPDSWLGGRTPLISYARVSADRLDGDSTGLTRQHRNNTRNAERLGCAVVLYYEDNNLTAAKAAVTRPAFHWMCQDIAHGCERESGIPVRGCVSVERERVYRLPRDFVRFQDALMMAGDGVFIEGSSVLDLACDDGLGLGLAEVDRVRTRTARSRADRAEEGRVFAGPRRFGWLGAARNPFRCGNKHRNDDEWPHLVAMIKARAAGMSWRGIAADLNRRGVGTARGGRWSEQGVKALVANPAWWGGRVLDGVLVTDPTTGEPVIGEWHHVDEELEGIGFETWKTIMTGVNAARLHRGMRREGVCPGPTDAMKVRAYLFSGVLRCGRLNDLGEVCHSKLSGNRATGRNAKYGDYYRCGDVNCRGIGRGVESVDRYLEGLVLDYLDEYFSGTTQDTTAWRGEEKLTALCVQRRAIEESVAAGKSAWGDVRDLLARLTRNIEDLGAERQEHLDAEAKRNLLRGWRREKWGSMALERRREVISCALTSVLVLPVPAGVSDKAPFDPSLLRPVWRRAAVHSTL